MQNKLDSIQIASPCRTKWDDMIGDDRKRFCSLCQLNVYNVSSMSRSEAEELLNNTDSKSVCLRLFRRADGTIITKDCPVGKELLTRAKRRMRAWAAIVANVFNFSPAAFADDLSTCEAKKQSTQPPTGQLAQLGMADKYNFVTNAEFSDNKGLRNLSTFLKEQSGQAESSAQTSYKRALMCERLNHLCEALSYAQAAKLLIEKNPEVYDAKFASEVSDKCSKLTKRVEDQQSAESKAKHEEKREEPSRAN